MEPVQLSEVLDYTEYERIRPEFRTRVLAEKELRRVAVGPDFTFLFENHLTLLYQVREMVRAEGIVKEDAIAHEVETYNELLPPGKGLAVTLLIEYTDPAERDIQLRRLVGMENHIKLAMEGLPEVKAKFDTRQMNDEKVSAVQYLQFPLESAHLEAWSGQARSGGIRIVVDHPNYSYDTVLSPQSAEALERDLLS